MKLTANSYFLQVVCKRTLPAAPVLAESVLSGGYLEPPSLACISVLRQKQNLSSLVWETVDRVSEVMPKGWVFFCVFVFVFKEN